MAGQRKTRLGHVIGDSMNKTVVVAVETTRHHPLYKKNLRKVVKYKAHDEKGSCHLGDLVKLIETRPISKQKRWKVLEIVTRGKVAEIQPKEIT